MIVINGREMDASDVTVSVAVHRPDGLEVAIRDVRTEDGRWLLEQAAAHIRSHPVWGSTFDGKPWKVRVFTEEYVCIVIGVTVWSHNRAVLELVVST